MDTKNDLSSLMTQLSSNPDISAEDRKKDHIEMALQSRTDKNAIDDRFYYDPLFSGHPDPATFFKPFSFLQKKMRLPIWVSSMTGGTELAGIINRNLARACKDFGMGMGLGSCRQLLFEDTHLVDFDVRDIIGDDAPLYANLGIAQVEELVNDGQTEKINILLSKLRADGLIIHVNPLQEWLQPEGDRLLYPAIDTIKRLLDIVDYSIVIKEVGQGMGRNSIEALLELPLGAIDFAASGGTNFSKLELLRNSDQLSHEPMVNVGHSAEQMVDFTNDLLQSKHNIKTQQIIVSGGITNFLDGYYLTQKLNMSSVYGQASAFLQHARGDYESLHQFVSNQAEGLAIAHSFLKVKS